MPGLGPLLERFWFCSEGAGARSKVMLRRGEKLTRTVQIMMSVSLLQGVRRAGLSFLLPHPRSLQWLG